MSYTCVKNCVEDLWKFVDAICPCFDRDIIRIVPNPQPTISLFLEPIPPLFLKPIPSSLMSFN